VQTGVNEELTESSWKSLRDCWYPSDWMSVRWRLTQCRAMIYLKICCRQTRKTEAGKT